MGRRYPQLSASDVARGLKAAGFEQRKTTGTSHQQWVGTIHGKFRKVTLDPPKQPFSHDLVTFMARQAGLSKKQFYELCSKGGAKLAAKNQLKWQR